ncbi:MAG: TldD/PmbA family protein [Candidatus Nanoarchaeia archaeon]
MQNEIKKTEILNILDKIEQKLRAKGAQDIVLMYNRGKKYELKFVNNANIKLSEGESESIDIFVNINKKLFTTTLNSTDEKSISACVANIETFAQHLEPKTDYFGIAEGPFKYSEIPERWDKKISNITEKEILELADLGIDAALKSGAKRASGILEFEETENVLLTSGNVKTSTKGTAAYFSIRALLDKSSSGHATLAECSLKKFNLSAAGQQAGEFAKAMANPSDAVPGKYDVLFSPLAFAVLLECIGQATSIFSVEAGTSWFSDKIGQKIAPEFVNICDDGRLPGGLGSCPYDDEGVPTQRTAVIEKGVLKTFLYNTSYARKYKTKTTANAGLFAPEPTNIILEAGSQEPNALLKDIKKGIYITNLWYTRFQNYATGDFSTIPRDAAFLVERGHLKPIKGIRLSDNMQNLLKNIAAIANDQKQILSWEVSKPTWCPHVLVKDLNITKPMG